MQLHDNLAGLLDAADHEQPARRLRHEEQHEEHGDGEDESQAKRGTPLRGGRLRVVECQAHVRGRTVAEGNAHGVHADEETAKCGRSQLGRVDGYKGHKCHAASPSEEPEYDEHGDVLGGTQAYSADNGQGGTKDRSSLPAILVHDPAPHEDAEECSCLEHAGGGANEGISMIIQLLLSIDQRD